MTREEAIKIIRKMLSYTDLTVRANLTADMVSACNLAIKALEQEPRWIPVSERLPEENICDDGYHEPSKRVLVYMKSGEMHVARYWSRYDYRWLGIITPTTDEVIAWMPLPKPYESQESEDKE